MCQNKDHSLAVVNRAMNTPIPQKTEYSLDSLPKIRLSKKGLCYKELFSSLIIACSEILQLLHHLKFHSPVITTKADRWPDVYAHNKVIPQTAWLAGVLWSSTHPLSTPHSGLVPLTAFPYPLLLTQSTRLKRTVGRAESCITGNMKLRAKKRTKFLFPELISDKVSKCLSNRLANEWGY